MRYISNYSKLLLLCTSYYICDYIFTNISILFVLLSQNSLNYITDIKTLISLNTPEINSFCDDNFMSLSILLDILTIISWSLIYKFFLSKNILKELNKYTFNKKLILPIILNATMLQCMIKIVGFNKSISYQQSSSTLTDSSNSITILIAGIFLIPLFEEILFRGILFKSFNNFFNIKISIFLQAIIFTYCHFDGFQNLFALFTTFIIGIMLGIIYYQTNSLLSTYLYHISFNLLSTILIYIFKSMIGFSTLPIIIILFMYTTYKIFSLHKKTIL